MSSTNNIVRGALTATQIPCCLCGTLILPNAANQCPSCLAQEFDLQETLQRGPGGADHITIHQCRVCRRYARTPKHYEHADIESPELLAILLKHIPALQNNNTSLHHTAGGAPLHLVDAAWIWTEPHSMRFKLRLTVRTEIQNVPVQQRCAVLLHCAFQMCPECNREYTNRTWQAVVQLRQKRSHEAAEGAKSGLAALEMALAKNKDVRKHVLRIDAAKFGFDFYFLQVHRAQAFASFLQRVAPMRVRTTRKLVSTDVKNNTANLKHTIACDVVPLCKDDLVLIHRQAPKCKLAGRLVLVVSKPTQGTLRLMDASPKRTCVEDSVMELSAESYYKHEKYYRVVLSSYRLQRFVALDAELCGNGNGNTTIANAGDGDQKYKGPSSGVDKYALADLELVRESDFGVNDETNQTVTHLGNLVSAGDVVLGYDLATTTVEELEDDLHSNFVVPDVVVVKKVSGDADKANQQQQQQQSEEGVDAAAKRVSKKRDRRRHKKEGKKMRELEESAQRMGFLQDDDDEYDAAAMEAELANDPELAAEVSALERDLEALGASMPAAEKEEEQSKGAAETAYPSGEEIQQQE